MEKVESTSQNGSSLESKKIESKPAELVKPEKISEPATKASKKRKTKGGASETSAKKSKNELLRLGLH